MNYREGWTGCRTGMDGYMYGWMLYRERQEKARECKRGIDRSRDEERYARLSQEEVEMRKGQELEWKAK